MQNPLLKNTFDHDTEGWQIYDYETSARVGREVFRPVTWERSGGVRDSGYVWADDSRWNIDTPENPHSILALIMYRNWVNRRAVDFREATLSVYLRGDSLDLKRAQCFFWAWNFRTGTRWHYSKQPLHISHGKWAEEANLFTLKNDASLWHRSWAIRYPEFGSLDQVLAECDSYGFSFVGFSENVTGKLSMDEFEIRRLRIPPAGATKLL